jgi:hypothetical protein
VDLGIERRKCKASLAEEVERKKRRKVVVDLEEEINKRQRAEEEFREMIIAPAAEKRKKYGL